MNLNFSLIQWCRIFLRRLLDISTQKILLSRDKISFSNSNALLNNYLREYDLIRHVNCLVMTQTFETRRKKK